MPRTPNDPTADGGAAPPGAHPGPVVLGVDLGATKVVSGIVAPDGTVLRHSGRFEHGNAGVEAVVAAVVGSASACLGGSGPEPDRIGVAVAAQVDPTTGTVVHAPNLGWRDVPLAGALEAALGRPVVLVNDARAAAAAEWVHGAGAGASDLFFLSLGTGVGGSAVVGGHLLDGGGHALGEVGHLTIVAGGRPCHCPNVGCFEAYVGGWGIAERAREAVRADPAGGAALLAAAGSVEAISADTVFRAERAGDALAARLVHETERFLADGAVSVVNAFNPSVLVLGGGLVSGRPQLVSVVAGAVRSRCQPSAAGVRVVRARFGEDAALVGAAVLARDPAQ
jgi:glucokinase